MSMESKPFKFIGFCRDEALPVKNGDMVTIPKGTPIRSTNPKRRNYVAGKTHKVKINHILSGCQYDDVITNPSVVWAGTNGWWCEVDINLVPEANKE